jgi:hypothetical protein
MDNNFHYIVESLLSKSKKQTLSEFIDKRSAGAKKIQKAAEEKGGPAKLTSIHFKAKEIPYKNCLRHLTEDEEDDGFIKEKADECFSKLKQWSEMSQREFQAVMGQLEAYGEIYIKTLESKK